MGNGKVLGAAIFGARGSSMVRRSFPIWNDAVKTHEVIFAADRSAEQGKSVKLPLER